GRQEGDGFALSVALHHGVDPTPLGWFPAHHCLACSSHQGSTKIAASDRPSSAALCGRSSGCFARQASTSCSSASGTYTSVRSEGGTGSARRCLATVWNGVSASNTTCPVSR